MTQRYQIIQKFRNIISENNKLIFEHIDKISSNYTNQVFDQHYSDNKTTKLISNYTNNTKTVNFDFSFGQLYILVTRGNCLIKNELGQQIYLEKYNNYKTNKGCNILIEMSQNTDLIISKLNDTKIVV